MFLPETQKAMLGWTLAAGAVATAVLILDLLTPLGYAVPMLYVLALLFTWFLPGWRSTGLMTGIVLLLTWVGTALSPGEASYSAYANRTMATALLLVVAGLVIQQKRVGRQRDAAHEAQRKAELRYRTMFEQAGVGVAQIDSRTGQFLKVNRMYCEIVALTEPEMLATTFMSITHPDDLAQDLGSMERLRSGEITDFTMEKRYVRKDGSIVWVSLNVSPLWYPGEVPSQHIAVVQDITARKQAEAALRESEERLSLAQSAAHMGIFDWDITTGVVRWSPETERIWGLPEGGYEGTYEHWRRLVHPEDLPAAEALTQRALVDSDTPYAFEHRIVHPDGTERWILAKATTIRNASGKAVRMVGLNMDITERKQAEQRLRDSEQRFRAFVMASSDMVYRMSSDWSEMRRFQGLDFIADTEAPSRTWLQKCIHPGDQARVMKVIQEVIKTKEIFEQEHRVLRVDGSVGWTFSRAVPMLNAKGDLIEWIGAASDVTARKRAEAERQKFVLLADHSVEFIGMCDLNFKPFYVNEAARRLVGLDSMEQACSTRVQDFFFPEDQDYITNEFFPKVLRNGRNEVEIRFRHFKTGSAIWMIYNVFQVHDEAGQLVGYATVSRDITARKQTEVALRESEARVRADLDAMIRLHDLSVLSMQNGNLQSVLEKIVDNAMAITGADFGNIQLLDPECSRLRIVAQRGFPNWWVEFWDTTSGGEGVCGAALGRGERIIVEDVEQSPIFTGTRALEMQRKAGVRAVQSTPLMNRSGKMLGIFSTHHKGPHRLDERTVRLLDLLARQAGDLIENARDEEALHWLNATLEQRVKERTAALVEANERWDWVVRATNDGVWDWDLIHDTMYFSPRWRAVHGFQISDQPESMPQWSERIHPEDRPRVLKNLQDYLAGKCEKFWEEYRIRRNDGSYMWLLDRGIAIFDDEGCAIRMVGADTDITWRKEAEEVLRRREHEFRTLADNVPAFFSYIDRDRRYRFVNKRYEELFGRSGEEIAAMTMDDLLGPDDYAQAQPHLDKALAGEPVSFEYRLSLPVSGERWFSAQYVPDRDEQGQVAGLFVLLADITALKSSEAALREREAQLRDLSTKLLQVQEDERRRIARDLHDDLTQRLAALAFELHGLRSASSGLDSALLSRLKLAEEAIEQLATDLQQMAHRLHPSILEHVGLEAAVREYVEEFAVRTGLPTEFMARDVPKVIPLDHATCLYRILQESLQNVRKHANATNVLVRLLRTSRGVGLCVHDDGRGIERSQDGPGRRGLGLTSMAERVGALKGEFSINSKPHDGTELYAWVPLEDAKSET